uniref:Uncharacterized protein n=1 Tax=Caenorhabditis japonica TaxID=281687 RepID=A0A8R1E2F2_CAEJA
MQNPFLFSPKSGIEFCIDETILSIHMINLGDFCRFNVNNNVPESFERTSTGIANTTVKVEKNLAQVTGITGTLVNELALFYKTEEFGDVACRDEKPGTIGNKFQIIISRLPDDQRTGVYSKCVWGAVSNGKTANSNSEKKKSAPLKRVLGLVINTNSKKDECYVACSLAFPGADGLIKCDKENRLDIGDWVEMHFSLNEYDTFFPSTPLRSTPRFNTKSFKKIPGNSRYSVERTKTGVKVTIDNLKLNASHKKGDEITDTYLGVIHDENKLISDGAASVKVVVFRELPKKGKTTLWILQAVTLSTDSSSSSEDEQESSEEEKVTPKEKLYPKNTSAPINNSEHNTRGRSSHWTPPNQRFFSNNPRFFAPTRSGDLASMFSGQGCSFPPPGPMAVPLVYPGGPGPYPGSPLFDPWPLLGGPFEKTGVGEFSAQRGYTGSSNRPKKGFRAPGFEPKSSSPGEQEELITKRAVVTSAKPNKALNNHGKDTIAFLWLIDDHISSVFFTASDQYDIQCGHFFEGRFSKNGSKWICQKYTRPLGKLMNGVTVNDSIELHVIVDEYFPVSPERTLPETYHSFIGKIVDQHEKLPKDCSSGVKIAVRLWNISQRNEWAWVVTKVFQSKYMHTLCEFYEMWKVPGFRRLVSQQCICQFEDLCELFDISSTGILADMIAVTSAEKESSCEKEEKEEEKVTDTFAWTTVTDDEFVRMIVFPRLQDQKISQMKRNVTDKTVYAEIPQIQAKKLYRVTLDEKREVVKMMECPQYFSAQNDGHIMFKFISCNSLPLAKNVAIVEPVGIPAAFGKLMFHQPEKPIGSKKVLAKAAFRFLDDEDYFADDTQTMEHGVCFQSVGQIDILLDQNLEGVLDTGEGAMLRKEKNFEAQVFKTKLAALTNDMVFSMFQEVCIVLKKDPIEQMLLSSGFELENLFALITKMKNDEKKYRNKLN